MDISISMNGNNSNSHFLGKKCSHNILYMKFYFKFFTWRDSQKTTFFFFFAYNTIHRDDDLNISSPHVNN